LFDTASNKDEASKFKVNECYKQSSYKFDLNKDGVFTAEVQYNKKTIALHELMEIRDRCMLLIHSKSVEQAEDEEEKKR